MTSIFSRILVSVPPAPVITGAALVGLAYVVVTGSLVSALLSLTMFLMAKPAQTRANIVIIAPEIVKTVSFFNDIANSIQYPLLI